MKKVFNDRIEWRNNKGEVHKEKGPAIEYNNGTKCWYKNGEHHRLDGPAIEHSDGTKYWCQNGKHHRLDGPAIECADGSKEWYLNGRAFGTEQEWFEALTLEQQTDYLFKLGEK